MPNSQSTASATVLPSGLKTSIPSTLKSGVGLSPPPPKQVAGGLLGALDIGLVERVDADDAAGDHDGVLPQQHLRRRAGRRSRCPAGRGADAVEHRSRAERHQDFESAVLGLKLTAFVDWHDDREDALALLAGGLCDELLDPVAETLMPVDCRRCTSLSTRWRCWRRRAGRRAAVLGCRRHRRQRRLDAGRRFVEQLRRHRRRPDRLARARTRSAPSSGHRRRDRRGTRDSRRLVASLSSGEPGSVTTTMWSVGVRPASVNAFSYARRWLSVSIVPPDLLATTTMLRSSRSAIAARTMSGCDESRTVI